MKTLLIAFLITLNTSITQEVEKSVATFDRYDDYIFYFIDDQGHSLEFENKEEDVWKKYDLVTGNFEGKKFEVSYTVEIETDDDGEEIFTSTIVDLKLLD